MRKFFSWFVPAIATIILPLAARFSGADILFLAAVPFAVVTAMVLKNQGYGPLAFIWLLVAAINLVNFLT